MITYPELAEALRASTPRIIREWQSLAQPCLQELDDVACNEFAEKLPQLLEQLVKVLESAQELCEPIPQSVDYEAYRFRSHLELPALFDGYDLLRTILMDELPKELKRGLTTEETLAVCSGIEVAVRCHLVAFIEHQKREFQAVSQARSMYVSYMAHDLRSGLNSVVMLTELLGEQLRGEQQFESSIADLAAI